ncbi:FG-GAP repeat domain-containing protein [Streptomyces sp. NPDC091377]|uniref:FG-GAP repeat domain-containing protein n=1 Tax=Streptomyces sp. NPDC091377 TaxID=3365995 RepID=UPI003825D979
MVRFRVRVRSGATVLAVVAAVLAGSLTACGSGAGEDSPRDGRTPVRKAAESRPARPVPRGDGSETPDDFNGDGHRDLVLNDLVKDQAHADDAGVGIVYGGPDGLVPGARQLLAPERYAARTGGQVPAAFDAEAGCDLDGDGFTDLVLTTDPPYDGQGRPPVPVQLLFGSPKGLAGKAVKLVVPDAARAGKDWPDHPVCGDFDGDGAQDLVLHASEQQLSYLRGPFDRKGAPDAAGAPVPAPGNVPTGPAADVDRDGRDDLVIRTAEGEGDASLVLGGPYGPTGTGIALPAGTDLAVGRFGRGAALDAAIGSTSGTALRYDFPAPTRASLTVSGTLLDTGDFDGDGVGELVAGGAEFLFFRGGKGRTTALAPEPAATLSPAERGTHRVVAVGDFDGDGRDDLVVRTYRGETWDAVGVYAGAKKGAGKGAEKGSPVGTEPVVTFSTAEFPAD